MCANERVYIRIESMNDTLALAVFGMSSGLILYAYAIYPALLTVLSSRRRPSPPLPSAWPTVTVLVSVFNEEKHIRERIENLLSLDYPADKLDILVGSDGSTDRTNEMVQSYSDPRIRLHAFMTRRGKPGVLNELVGGAKGEILVFTDANTMFAGDALRKLVRHFMDPRIGGVCGQLILHGDETETHEGAYWKWENQLKQRESDLDSCLGANGGIYAIRRSAWTGIPDNTLIDDFVIAMRVRERGLRVIYDAEALATEEMPPLIGHEMTRRIRIGAGGFQSLFLCWRSLLPWQGVYVLAFWSHKVLRWFVPFFMITALLANFLLLPSPFFAGIMVLQLAFYALALAGSVLRKWKSPLFRGPRYFVAINLALLLGFFRFLTRTQGASWKRTVR